MEEVRIDEKREESAWQSCGRRHSLQREQLKLEVGTGDGDLQNLFRNPVRECEGSGGGRHCAQSPKPPEQLPAAQMGIRTC